MRFVTRLAAAALIALATIHAAVTVSFAQGVAVDSIFAEFRPYVIEVVSIQERAAEKLVEAQEKAAEKLARSQDTLRETMMDYARDNELLRQELRTLTLQMAQRR